MGGGRVYGQFKVFGLGGGVDHDVAFHLKHSIELRNAVDVAPELLDGAR